MHAIALLQTVTSAGALQFWLNFWIIPCFFHY